MLPDMLLPDYNIDYVAIFESRTQIDNRDLTALILFAGGTGSNYSNQLPDGFTFARDDITIEIDRATGKSGAPFLGRNGVMRPDKNTTVSAVTYSSRLRPSVSLLNPHATLPLRPSWLAGTVYQVQDNGDVVVVRG